MTVLILARNIEPQVDAVVYALAERDVTVFRTDLAAFPRSLSLTAELGTDGWIGELRTQHRSVNLEDIHAVWYRHPSHFILDDTLSRPERRHAMAEARCGVGGVLSSLDALWMNHPSRESDALKPRQLAVARRCGLSVPQTLITNRRDTVADFGHRVGDTIATKNLSGAVIAESGRVQAAFTRRLAIAELDDPAYLDGVESTAHLFQSFVSKAYEARVTVVGPHVFAAGIHAGSAASRLDFRADYDNLTYSQVEPPAGVVEGMRAFMSAFGLVFGAFDFGITTDGEWVMFECNPFGAYGWLEHHLGFPITAAIADILATGTPEGSPTCTPPT